jgi:uncharacterized protein YjbK
MKLSSIENEIEIVETIILKEKDNIIDTHTKKNKVIFNKENYYFEKKTFIVFS